jgi:hypothetical protein
MRSWFMWLVRWAAIFSFYCAMAAVWCWLTGWSVGDVFGTFALGAVVAQHADRYSKKERP